MAISLVTIIVMGLLLYHRFKLALEKTAVDNAEATVEGTVDRLNADLLDIRQIFNGANYNVVQQFDISSREFVEQFSLLYETNSDKVQSVALYDHEGKLIASEPVALEKKNVQVQTQEWYENAENAIENVQKFVDHMKTPAAVVCATDRIAFGVYKVMSEKGIRIPEEVSVVGFGDYEAGELLQPPLTTVKFDWKNWGEISAESMIQMILGKPVSPLQVNPYEIIERKSVKEN